MTSRCWLPVFAVALFAGCQTMDVGKMSSKLALTRNDDDKLKASEFETPVRLIAIWSDAVYNQPGQVPTRGFGGRLYFYNAQDKTVPVEGQLIVYAYDELPDGTPAKTPSRRFGFTPEQFTSHYSATELGASYSVWIPWDPLGGDRKSITLLPAFTSSSGHVVMGEQSITVLPGKAPESPALKRPSGFMPLGSQEAESVRPVVYNQSPARGSLSRDSWQQTHTFEPDMENQLRPRSTTIPLPMTMTKRLVQEVDAPATQASALETFRDGMQGDFVAPMGHAQAGSDGYTMASEPAASEPAASPPPAARFARPRYQAPRVQAVPPSPVRAATTPPPAAPPLGPPSPLPTNPGSSAGGFVPDASGHAGWAR